MEIQKRLIEIWSQDYINTLPEFVKDRGFCFSNNNETKEILITGINPSFRDGENKGFQSFDFQFIANEERHDNYWSPLKKMLFDAENNIDLRMQTSYLDIFYFREKEQEVLRKQILPNPSSIQFIIDQMNLTQHIIEDIIKPKIIIVKNKESAAYWGKLSSEGIIWMGYELEFIQNTIIGELYKIKGLIDTAERISPEITATNLENTLVLFTQHINQYTATEKRPTANIIKTLLDYYNSKIPDGADLSTV